MTDKEKLSKVRAEIERLKKIAVFNLSHSKMDRGAWMQQASVCTNLLSFIDSIQKEPASEDLEQAIDNYLATYWGGEKEKQDWPFLKKMAIHFAAWQKQQMMAKAIDGVAACATSMEEAPYVRSLEGISYLKGGDKVKLIVVKEE